MFNVEGVMREEAVEPDGRPELLGLVWGCCFCGGESDGDLVYSVVLCDPSGEEHTWWCHKECFFGAMLPKYRNEPGD
jgi:hypothetical protein